MQQYCQLSIAVLCLIAMAPAWGQERRVNPKQAYLTAKEGGADFEKQGEYVGKLGETTIGVQVIARGNGKFDAVTFVGGLPGAGFDGDRKLNSTYETKDGVTKASGDNWEARIADGKISVELGGQKAELNKVVRESPTLGKAAPANATILFDGTNFDQWKSEFVGDGGLLAPRSFSGIRTKKTFEDYTLHLEFRTPFMPYATGQARGNSGMYLGDQYECQVLDSFGLEGADNECGGIYQNSKPKVNMCFPPLSWQTYDVDFTSAKFDADGKVTAPARATIKHNGVVIHDNLELKVTPGGGRNDQKAGSIFLQDHGDPVRFRNVWLVEKK